MDEQEKRNDDLMVRLSMQSERHISTAGARTNEEVTSRRHDSQEILTMFSQENVSDLKDVFQTVSGRICLYSGPQQERKYFGHFEVGTRMNSSVRQIEKKIEERVGLTLLRDCLLRLRTSHEFTNELENIMENYLSYYKDLQEKGTGLERDFLFKSHRFHELCLTAKDHLTFWSMFTERCSSESRVQYTSPRLQSDIRWAHTSLLRVISRFTTLISNILVYVLDIACFLQWQMSDGLLKDISSAIEDLNRLLEYSKSVLNDNDVLFKISSTSSFSDSVMCKLSGLCSTIRLVPSRSVCSVSLSKLFQDTAKKRASVFVGHVLSFVQRQEISGKLNSNRVHKLEWKEFNAVPTDHQKLNQDNVIKVRGRNYVPAQLELDPNAPLLSFESIEYKFITELISKLATSNSLMSSHGVDKKLYMHKSLPQKGLYHADYEEAQDGQGSEGTVHTHDTESGHSILKHSPCSLSPRLNKRVQWHHSIDVDSIAQLSVLYMEIFWSSCSLVMCQMLEGIGLQRNYGEVQGPLHLWSDSTMMSFVKGLETLQTSESLPPDGSKSLQLVSRYINCIGAMAGCDKGFCVLVSTAQNDKCTSSTKPDDFCPSSKTIEAILNMLHPLSSIFQAAQKWTTHYTGPNDNNCSSYLFKDLATSLLPLLNRMQAILSFALCWLDTKLYHFLSGWTLSPFFMLIHWDMPILVEALNKTLARIQPICVGQAGNYSWGLLAVQLEELQELLNKIKQLGNKFTHLFEDDLKKMSLEFFQEAMPVGKVWKKSRQSGIPCKHNSYVEHAIIQILEPVIHGASLLSLDSQQNILALTTTIMMEGWSTYILKEEIIFSFYGAQQMQLDFNYIKCWISSDSSGLLTEMQSRLLSLDIFHHLDGATHLLMLQPRKKKQMDELDVELESNISAVSSSSVLSSFSGVDIDGYEIDILNDKTIPNKQLWLDLRLRGGKSKKGLMPFCLKVQETK